MLLSARKLKDYEILMSATSIDMVKGKRIKVLRVLHS